MNYANVAWKIDCKFLRKVRGKGLHCFHKNNFNQPCRKYRCPLLDPEDKIRISRITEKWQITIRKLWNSSKGCYERVWVRVRKIQRKDPFGEWKYYYHIRRIFKKLRGPKKGKEGE